MTPTDPIRVMVISGSLPPEVCGVGDYAGRLSEALEAIGLVVTTRKVSRGRHVADALREIAEHRTQIAHVQYPSVGYGKTLWPHLFAGRARMRTKVVLTLHEYQAAHPARRAAAVGLAGLSEQIIFTEETDRNEFPLRRRGTQVIPIGSNLPAATAATRDLSRVIYFGLLRPNRGLEDFLELACISRESEERFTFEVIGAIDDRRKDYAGNLIGAHPHVLWTLGLSADAAAARIASSGVAYLPYPDGASGRRGSLLAVLRNEVPVITTRGRHTPPDLARCVLLVEDVRSALARLRSVDPATASALAASSKSYLDARTWPTIARAHVESYAELLAPA